MTKRILTAAAAAALFIPALVFAQVDVVNGEKGMVFKDSPSTITRAEVRAQMQSPEAARETWKFVGGEVGWVLSGPRYQFEHGQMVHAADCPMMARVATPKPSGGGDLGYTGA